MCSEALTKTSERIASKSGQRAVLKKSQKNLQKPLEFFLKILYMYLSPD